MPCYEKLVSAKKYSKSFFLISQISANVIIATLVQDIAVQTQTVVRVPLVVREGLPGGTRLT